MFLSFSPPTRALRLALMCVLLLVSLLLSSCSAAVSAQPGLLASGGSSPTAEEVAESVFQASLLAVSVAQASAVTNSDGEACLALAIASGSIRMSWQVFHESQGEIDSPDGLYRPPPMVVDAASCVPLGIPAPTLAGPREAELRAAGAMGVAAARSVAVMLCSSLGEASAECQGASWAAASVDIGLEAWSAVALALEDEAAHPDGVVVVQLPELQYPYMAVLSTGEPGDDPHPHAVPMAAVDDDAIGRWMDSATPTPTPAASQ